MLILEFVLGILIGMLVLILPAVAVLFYWGMACDEQFENENTITILTVITIVILLGFGIFYPTSQYYSRLQEVEKLSVTYNYNLDNILTTANKLNEKVVIKSTNDKLIIDVANFSQSTKTSDVFIAYTNKVIEFNNEIAEYVVKSKPGIFNTIMFGFYPELPKDIRYIKIQM